MSMNQATVCIPVYNAYEALCECLHAIEHTAGLHIPVVIADDASTDERIAPLIEEYCERSPTWRSITNAENLGFVATANRLFDEVDGDVVLLNSDTVPCGSWYEALCLCLDRVPDLATATPFSNNAEICSYPNFCVENEPCAYPALLSRAMADLEPRYPALPTGVGFCMLVTRRALQQLGSFNQDAFGKGYGEENDFCLRAAAAGLKNILCDNAYVIHRGGASFGPLGLKPNGENLQRLNAMHPGYDALIARFIEADPIKPVRAALAARYAQLYKENEAVSTDLPFTGERFTPECVREIAYEHWHRYAFAQTMIADKEVLDIACGEGYGSALLAASARHVTGVDIDPVSVSHAAQRYGKAHPNLDYVVGDVAAIPLKDDAVDVVVSFETIEHITAQKQLLAEIDRVLRDEGLLIISSPDRHMYSDVTGFVNEHHVKELYREELEALLGERFAAYRLFGQKLLFQSAIWQLGNEQSDKTHSARLNHGRIEHTSGPAYDPIYFIAVCARSKGRLPEVAPTLSLYGDREESVYEHYNDEVRRNMHAGAVIKEMEKHMDYLKSRVAELETQAPPTTTTWWSKLFKSTK